MTETVHLDFTRICRACKCDAEEMVELFAEPENEHLNPRIDEMLMACAAVQVSSDDDLPNLLCKKCAEKLTESYLFKIQCEKSDESLRDLLKQRKLSDVDKTYNLLNDLQEMLDYKPPAERNVSVKLETADPQTSMAKCDYIEIMDNNQLILTCKECFKVFTTLDGLKCHKRLHSGALFKCKQCDKEYTRLNHLQRHELTHGRRKVHVCKICNKTLTRFEHLKRHLVTHLKEKPFACEKCGRGFNRSEHLLNHTERCKGDRIHICDICNKGFNRADSLEVHRRLHDNKVPALPTLDNLNNIEEHYIEIDYDENATSIFDDLDDDAGYEMDDSDCFEPQVSITENEDNNQDDTSEPADIEPMEEESNEYEEEIIKSEDKNEPAEEDVNVEDGETPVESNNTAENDCYDENVENDSDSGQSEYTPTKTPKIKRGRGRPRKNSFVKTPGRRGRPPKIKDEIKDEPDEDEDGEYPCPICNEMFKKVSLLEKHGSQHEGAKLFKCKVCKNLFRRASHLKRHMASHSESKPYACEICTKSFNRRDHLTQHMKLHSRAQEFECDVCKRPFSRADHLAKHKLSKHNQGERVMGEKKYKCAVCMKGFTTEKYRDVHMQAHTGEKKFSCRTCDKTFLSKSHLTEHMKFHNDNSKKFLCSECGQRFIRNDYLVIHMRRHRGEKPFKCKFCGKGFPRTTDLTVHERYHTGEKTHLCVICGRGFGRAYNLTVHMRTHTGEKPYQCTYCDAAFAQGNDLKAHVRRHTGERFQCELCTETFLMGYLLTQHKRTVHGLNVVSNIRRLQPVNKVNPDEPPPITISLPPPVVPSAVLNAQLHAQIAVTQLQQIEIIRE